MTDLGPIEGEYERDYWEDPQTQAERAIARRDRRIAELEAAWDRYRHDIAELTAQVERAEAERDKALARAERAEAVIAQVREALGRPTCGHASCTRAWRILNDPDPARVLVCFADDPGAPLDAERCIEGTRS